MTLPELVDCHTHVVSRDQLAYPLQPRDLSGNWYLEGPASAEDLAREMSTTGVTQAVLVQGVGAYSYDNSYAVDSAAADPAHFVSACAIDVEADDAIATLDDWAGHQRMAGVRLFAISRDGPSWLAEERITPIWERAAELGLHVIVTILPHQLGELERVLRRYPDTAVSLDHCAFALPDPDARDALYALAGFRNLHLKVSTHNLDHAARIDGSARPLVNALVARFGADRLMWGSDYCQTFDRPYAELVALGRDAFGDLDDANRAACFSGNARKLWPGLAEVR